MMAILFIEPGSDATYGLEFFSGIGGTVSSSATQAKTGPRSISLAAGTGNYVYRNSIAGNNGRVSIWWYAESHSTGNVGLIFHNSYGAPATQFGVGRKATGVLAIFDATFTERAAGTSSISSGWHRVSIAWSYTSSSVNDFRVWLDGVLEVSTTNVTWTTAPNGQLYFLTGSGNNTCYIDDIYVDDSTSLTDPGDIRVTAKLPVALNTNNFDTLVGTGTNRYDRVSERAISVSNGIQHAGTSDVQENFGIQAASAGDVNISGANILGYTGWIYAKRGNFEFERYSVIDPGSSKVNTHTSTVLTVTLVDQVGTHANGDAIFVAFACDDNGNPGTTATCADSRSNTYNAADSVQFSTTGSATGCRVALFVATNVTALQNGDTITVTHGAIVASAISAQTRGGITTSSPKDVSATNSFSGSSGNSGATATLASANALAFGVGAMESESADIGTQSLTNATGGGGGFISGGTTGGGAASNMSVAGQTRIVNGTSGITYNLATTGSSRDVSLLAAVYKGVTGANTAGDPKLMLNGTEYSKALTTSNALYSQVVTDTSYPSNAAGIGMRSSGTTADTYLYECGVVVAYIPSTFSHLPLFRPRRSFSVRI